jgi:hypothetical protein
MNAADHRALYQEYLTLAGEVRVVAHRTDLVEELSGITLALLEISTIHKQASEELERKERIVKLRTLFVLIGLIGLLLLGVLAVAAQDETLTPDASTAVPTEVVPTALPTTDPLELHRRMNRVRGRLTLYRLTKRPVNY